MQRFFSILVLVCLLATSFFAHIDEKRIQQQVTFRTEKVAGNVHVLFGNGGNIGLSVGPDGILMIDTQFANVATQVKAEMAKLGSDKPRFIFNTHWHGDHTGGNEPFGKDSLIIAHENVRKRMEETVMFRGQARTPSPNIATTKAPPSSDTRNPETWIVRFALALPRDPRTVPDACAPHIRALWGQSTAAAPPCDARGRPYARSTPLQLARRFEALRRVLIDPTSHARRLAVLLRRLVRRFPEAPRRFVLSSARSNHFDREDPRLGVDCAAASLDGLPSFNSN